MEGEAKRTISKDLMPTLSEERNWGIYNFIALWIGMDIGIPTYYLASGLIAGGLDMKGAIFTILLGNDSYSPERSCRRQVWGTGANLLEVCVWL